MPEPSVTALLIVRNEKMHIRECIASLSGSVDEVVAIDTGSTDETPELARQLGARIFYFPWNDDFSAARNFAIERCRTDWALYIDADERLAEKSRGQIKGCLDPNWLAADILLRPKTDYTRYRLARLFRIDPRIRFEGAIHETILPALTRISSNAIALTPLEIDHRGYEGDLTLKHLRNLPLLQRCCREYPSRAYYWSHLTETLLGLGRPEDALSAGRTGIEAARQAPSARSRVDAAVICQLLAAYQLSQGTDPAEFLQQGLAFHPVNYGLLLTLAKRHLDFGDAAVSLEIARKLQREDPDQLTPDIIAYDRGIFGRQAVEMEIACLRKLGRKEEAASVLVSKVSRL